VPRCLPDLGIAWAKSSRKVLDDPTRRALGNHVPTENNPKECAACGALFRPLRSTARFCGPRCRKAAQRARDRGTPVRVPATRPGVGQDAVLSVTAPIGMPRWQNPRSVTLKAPKINPRIVPDPKWPWMYRIKRPDGSLTDMTNLTRAKEALSWS